MRSTRLLDMAWRVADHVAAGYYPAEDGVSMITRSYGYDVPLIREIRTQLSEDPDTLPVCLSLLDQAAERAEHPPRAMNIERPDATRLYRGRPGPGRVPAVNRRRDG